jgi:hypothetical protein
VQNDSEWLLQQVRDWTVLSVTDFLASLGPPAEVDAQGPNLHLLMPHHPRLRRAMARTQGALASLRSRAHYLLFLYPWYRL